MLCLKIFRHQKVVGEKWREKSPDKLTDLFGILWVLKSCFGIIDMENEKVVRRCPENFLEGSIYIYSKLFHGYEFLFMVIDKKTNQIGLFDCSPQFYERGAKKVEAASEQYDLFFKNDNFDPKQYLKTETL